jgi:membrane protein required for colicin V production
MTWLDWVAIGVLAASIAWGVWRGLVRELMSLAGWVIAFLAANLLAAPVAEVMPETIRQPELRTLLGFALVFLGTLVVTTLCAVLLGKMVHAAGLGGLDRLLGGLFGLLRGLLIMIAFALAAGLTTIPTKAFWKDSASGGVLAAAALTLKPWLPAAFAQRLRYH